MDRTVPGDRSNSTEGTDTHHADFLIEILSFFALECGWSPDQTLDLSLDALSLLAQGISKRKVDWIEGIVQGIFGKPSKKQAVVDTLKKLDGLKARGLVEDI